MAGCQTRRLKLLRHLLGSGYSAQGWSFPWAL
jgi:hypothetical protein